MLTYDNQNISGKKLEIYGLFGVCFLKLFLRMIF